MKLDLKKIQSITAKLLTLIKRYAAFIFILISLGIFGFLVIRIKSLVSREPSETTVSEKSNQNKPVNIDESAVKKVEQLKSANVEVKALFEQSRDNPFQE